MHYIKVCTQGEAVSTGRRSVPAQCLLSTLEIPQFQKGKKMKKNRKEEKNFSTDKEVEITKNQKKTGRV